MVSFGIVEGMNDINPYLHEVAITAIVVKDGKYLITRRSPTKKRWPGKWTVPGGKLEVSDYTSWPKDTHGYWYNVLEKTLRREVQEEVGLEIDRITYVTSLATVHDDKAPSLVISCMAEWKSGEVVLQQEECDAFAWMSVEDAKQYDLIDGIYDELVMTEQLRNGEQVEWKRHD